MLAILLRTTNGPQLSTAKYVCTRGAPRCSLELLAQILDIRYKHLVVNESVLPPAETITVRWAPYMRRFDWLLYIHGTFDPMCGVRASPYWS